MTLRILSVVILLTVAGAIHNLAGADVDALVSHPNGDQLKRCFTTSPSADFRPTQVTVASYLKLIAGNVDFFKACQDIHGAIIDPVSKGERQYSTPAFAAAAGILVQQAGRSDLRPAAEKALSHALEALIQGKTADGHSDFYIPLLVHAYRFLKDGAEPDVTAKWKEQFGRILPDKMYNAKLRGMNWNVVSCSGELLRRSDGLVAPDLRDAQMQYLETCLNGHIPRLTPLGLFEDPGAPMAYDAFSRLWLEDVFADNAYDGKFKGQIQAFLRTGGLSTLLMISPTGEWPTGGRSALHNWTDAEVAAICEMNARYWKAEHREDIAGSFKRAAHLAFQSVSRWQRPSGELWIIKNHAEPDTRFAYETYSNHSQYNLLPMAMLAIAASRADDTIAERPMPSEIGGYVFDAREKFHKVFAAAAGYYIEIDTAGDPHYNATGLQRVHRLGVPYSALSDTAAPERAYQPGSIANLGLSLGMRWRDSQGDWVSLSSFSGPVDSKPSARPVVTARDLKVVRDDPAITELVVRYTLDSSLGQRIVTEQYQLSEQGVLQRSSIDDKPDEIGVHLPVLVSDGAKSTAFNVAPGRVKVTLADSTTTVSLSDDSSQAGFKLGDQITMTHCGEVREAQCAVRGMETAVRVELSQAR